MGGAQVGSGAEAPPWVDVIPRIEPIVFQVCAGDAIGTAFAISRTVQDGGRHTMLATAWHVVKDVVSTDAPLVILRSDGTDTTPLVVGPARIYPIGPEECDTALLAIPTSEPLIREEDLGPIPLETMLPKGAELGWLGFPGIVYPELCFFCGVVSGHKEVPPVYLIDGVGINGVSGGPAFDRSGLIVGLVSAYLPNQIEPGRTLPGLMILTPVNMIRLWMQDIFRAKVNERK